jgi:hypothetical protein
LGDDEEKKTCAYCDKPAVYETCFDSPQYLCDSSGCAAEYVAETCEQVEQEEEEE